MPNKAPANWEKKTLEELCNLQNGYAFSSKDYVDKSNTINIRMSNIRPDGSFDETHNIKYLPDDYAEQYNDFILQDGDLIIAMTDMAGDPKILGVPTIVKHHSETCLLMNQRVGKLYDISNTINVDFLKYFLISPEVRKIYKSKGKGGLQLNISKKDILSLMIAVPPLTEQERIVRILDEVFKNIEKAKQNTLQNLNNAKELFESHLKTFFEKNNSDWREYRLIDITSKIGSGSTPLGGKKSYTNEGISLIRSMNVHDRQFVYEGLAHINEQQANELNGVTICENDVLLNITGASVARCCVVPNDVIPARVNQHVSIIRPRLEYVSAKFLCYLLTSKYYKDRLLKEGEEGGATRQALTKSGLEQFVISIPEDLDMQEKVVGQLEKIHEYTQKLEQTYNKKLQSLDELKQSILQKAFNGEL